MELIERMIGAGLDQASAAEAAAWYLSQGDDDGLESYVIALEGRRR